AVNGRAKSWHVSEVCGKCHAAFGCSGSCILLSPDCFCIYAFALAGPCLKKPARCYRIPSRFPFAMAGSCGLDRRLVRDVYCGQLLLHCRRQAVICARQGRCPASPVCDCAPCFWVSGWRGPVCRRCVLC